MEEPAPQDPGTTHVYVARAWYRDTATLYLIGSFLWFVIQDQANVELFVPHKYHDLVAKNTLLGALFIRWQSSTRPVALKEGTPREVRTIPPRQTN